MKAVSYIALALSVIALALGIYAISGGFSSAGTAVLGTTTTRSATSSGTTAGTVSGTTTSTGDVSYKVTISAGINDIKVNGIDGVELATIKVSPMTHASVGNLMVFDGFFVRGITVTSAGNAAFANQVKVKLPAFTAGNQASVREYSDAAVTTFATIINVADLNAKLLAAAKALGEGTLKGAIGLEANSGVLKSGTTTAVTGLSAGTSTSDFGVWVVAAENGCGDSTGDTCTGGNTGEN